MRYYIILLVFIMFPGVASGQTAIEEFNNTVYSTPYIVKVDKDTTKWTTWNKVLFTSAITGQVADIVSTQDGLDRGCFEGNPIYGEHPEIMTMVLIKGISLGVSYYVTEYVYDGHPNQQKYRNWIYGFNSILGFGIAGYNYSTDCN